MTEEERNNAIKVLKNFDLNNPKINSLLFSADEITNAFNMAIKALEQEPIIDKLRAEILRKSYGGFELGDGFVDGYNTAMVRVLNILDKYKVESEG